ncbi:hypothetical protein RsTz2092_09870 [Deferribacterales bacterium RsTz2092]|nr:hypothetical protein AGMMS49941_03250 [Deferribacterales bacterium]
MTILKILFKTFCTAIFIGVLCAGFMVIKHKLYASARYNVQVVEVRGVKKTDMEQLKLLFQPLVGQNIFSDIKVDNILSNEPWVERLSVRRVLPATIVVRVGEAYELLRYRNGNACATLVSSGAKIAIPCGGVRIDVAQMPLDAEFKEFLKVYEFSELAQRGVISLRSGFWTLTDGGITFVAPYNAEVFNYNYQMFVNDINQRYRSIERVDVTVKGRIYVKGVANNV